MKARYLRLSSYLITMAIFFSLIPSASAGFVTKTENTPYGEMTASSAADWNWEGHGILLRAMAGTRIDSSVTMRKITTTTEAQYSDTGEQIWQHTFEEENVNETPAYNIQVNIAEPGRGCTVYTAHQVLYTDAYVIYLVTTTSESHPDLPG